MEKIFLLLRSGEMGLLTESFPIIFCLIGGFEGARYDFHGILGEVVHSLMDLNITETIYIFLHFKILQS